MEKRNDEVILPSILKQFFENEKTISIERLMQYSTNFLPFWPGLPPSLRPLRLANAGFETGFSNRRKMAANYCCGCSCSNAPSILPDLTKGRLLAFARL
ncbi:MAG: hypothetical protein K9J37_21100 [Saprospiraceae bacterium]|nr:hypothetical protein [Saprospiraceae bacterium]MCF8252418.1 hypothetical protein [Saprospiraceae bacterium]MCF8280710.1 hypothetical protein [Bacteroidales bacterium]MCF8314014.1 hypothetical protein [Saprospiraceae bacterium]MCF8442748.1 hypothetical protein [Saprospiraceae bacterium]